MNLWPNASRKFILAFSLAAMTIGLSSAAADDRDYESPEIRKAIQLLEKNGAHVQFYQNYDDQTSYYVNLYATKANPENLQALLVLPKIERLWLGANFELSPLTWSTITQLGELQHLHVFGSPTDADLMQIAQLSNLISLQLGGNNFSPAGLWYLEELTLLEQLTLKIDGNCEPYFAYLARLPNLNQLSIYDPNSKEVSLKGIENFAALRTLSINFGHIPGSALKTIPQIASLKALTLTNVSFNGKDMEIFRKLKQLEHLNLHHCEFPSDNFTALEGLVNVQHMTISHSNLIDDAMTTLGGLPGLNYLYLNLTPITDTGLKNLKDAKGLETLHLRSTDVTQAGVDWLSEELPNLRVIAPLNN